MNNYAVYDIEKGISLAGGNRKLALELISMLIAQLPVQKFEIAESINNSDMVSLRHHIHKLHGSCQCCATPALLNVTKNIQNMIDKNLENEIEAAKAELFIEIDRVLRIDTTIL